MGGSCGGRLFDFEEAMRAARTIRPRYMGDDAFDTLAVDIGGGGGGGGPEPIDVSGMVPSQIPMPDVPPAQPGTVSVADLQSQYQSGQVDNPNLKVQAGYNTAGLEPGTILPGVVSPYLDVGGGGGGSPATATSASAPVAVSTQSQPGGGVAAIAPATSVLAQPVFASLPSITWGWALVLAGFVALWMWKD
jgi:hypothetical protein